MAVLLLSFFFVSEKLVAPVAAITMLTGIALRAVAVVAKTTSALSAMFAHKVSPASLLPDGDTAFFEADIERAVCSRTGEVLKIPKLDARTSEPMASPREEGSERRLAATSWRVGIIAASLA
jgi:hypothetical protein